VPPSCLVWRITCQRLSKRQLLPFPARHFVNAPYQCGFTAEADRLLLEMCEGFAAASVFGGNKSGVDWRFWGGRPCGYEGLLTDQFGLLEVLFQRYGRP